MVHLSKYCSISKCHNISIVYIYIYIYVCTYVYIYIYISNQQYFITSLTFHLLGHRMQHYSTIIQFPGGVEVEDWHKTYFFQSTLSPIPEKGSVGHSHKTQQSTRGPGSGTQGIGRNLYSVTIRYPHMLVNIPVFIRISMVMVFESLIQLVYS